MTNVVDILMQSGNFKMLVQTIKVADLTETLRGAGPFTVFAPNDDAFAKLPKETILELIKDTQKLKNVLLYHVLPGKIMAADIAKLKEERTLQGKTVFFEISTMRKVPKVNDVEITKTDLIADNGIVHVIEKVLIPQ